MRTVLVCLVLGAVGCADQVNCIKLKDSTGATVATYCKPFTFKAGSNVTFSNDDIAKVLTISSAISSSSIGSDIRLASTFPGSNLGAQINAADADLGTSAGEIWATGGGVISTQVIISSNHTLRLFPGTYTNAFGEYIPPFLLKNNSSLMCTSWETVIQNSSNSADNENVVVGTYNATVGGSGTTGALVPNNSKTTSQGIKVEGCHFADSGLGKGTSLTGIIALNNCLRCKANNNWFDEMATTHITFVGSSQTNSYYGDLDEAAHNLSVGAKDAAISVIDNSNVDIHDNIFRHHGNGAAAFIDLESNRSTDLMEFIDIHNNVMDMSDAVTSVYGVTLQSAGTLVRQIKIHDNIMHGVPPGGTNHFITGIEVGVNGYAADSMSDVEVYNNQVSFTTSDAISAAGVTRAWIHDNKVLCSGGKAIAVFGNTLDSIIERNTVSAPLSYCDLATTNYRVLQFTTIAEVASTADRNIYRDNIAGRVTTLGASSKIINTTPILGTGVTYRVPIGFTSIAGGLATSQLSAPTLSITTNAVGSCVISGPTLYYWRVTSVGANGGESDASNEVSQFAGGANGCPNLSWTYVPGAVSFNIYRFTASNGELLVANVAGGDLFYADLGGQSPGAAYPTTNSTGGVLLNSETAPTCAAAFRGLITYTFGGAGVKDIVQVCAKDAGDAYAYRAIY
jgi:hypothetical protein